MITTLNKGTHIDGESIENDFLKYVHPIIE